MKFSHDFWSGVKNLNATLRYNLPLCSSNGVRELSCTYQQSSPESQEELKKELAMLTARLIQIDQVLRREECCASSVECG
jgi:hypothetical protein